MRLRFPLGFLLLSCAAAVFGNTITVTAHNDTLATNGQCSIREALVNANDNAATWPDCAAGSGADVINLPSGTITLSVSGRFEDHALTGDLDVLDSLTVNGDAASGTTIDAAHVDRVFDANPHGFDPEGPAITFALRDVTIVNGDTNGDGGGVAIEQGVTATLERVTLANCTTNNDGGGLLINQDGLNPVTVTMINCTVTGNSCPWLGGGIKSEARLTMKSCTVTNNRTTSTVARGQGLLSQGVTHLQNTIIAGNNEAATVDVEGTYLSDGYNVIGSMLPATPPAAGDQLGVTTAQVNLAALANNGGTTLTMLPQAGSVVLDQGKSDGVTLDQRNLTRPCDQPSLTNAAGGDGADVGAVEVQGTCASPNAPPVANDDAYMMNQDTTLTILAPGVLANDTDADNDSLTAVSYTSPSHGMLTPGADGGFIYKPNAGYIGVDTFTYKANDGSDDSNVATVTITIHDTQPPAINASVAAGSLWPPNHELVNVGFSLSISDNGGAFTSSLAVYSNEDDLTPASGDMSPDAKNVAAGTLRLRAERSGSGHGRVYLIIVKATDSSSNTSQACVTVTVPKSQSPSDLAAVANDAAAAQAQCTAPAGWFVVGDGPQVVPKQ